MKIVALSEIHGNLEALEAVCADVDGIEPDKVYCIGDIVGYGCNPRECVEIIRDRDWPTVIGNWEQVVMAITLAVSESTKKQQPTRPPAYQFQRRLFNLLAGHGQYATSGRSHWPTNWP